MAEPTALGILLLVLLLQFKHAIFDGPLQTRWMLGGKGDYGAVPGLAHSGLHLAGSLAVLLIFGAPAIVALVLAVGDGFVHYHADWIKERVVRGRNWGATDREFWWALAADQLAHHVTYVAMAALVVVWAMG